MSESSIVFHLNISSSHVYSHEMQELLVVGSCHMVNNSYNMFSLVSGQEGIRTMQL